MIFINQTYTVKPGDTLYGISNQFGVSVTELAELNGIKGSILNVGVVLKIPSKSGTNPNNMFMYTVKQGDTLYSIARKYNTTAQAIKDLNYFTDDKLSIGQVIRIPEMFTKEEDMTMPRYINYTVQKGDNLYAIANKYNVSVDTLKKDNGLTSNLLNVGQIIRIRKPSEDETIVEECFGPDYTPPDTTPNTTYTVKKGDSLYIIAKNYNTSVSAIQNLNNLTNTNLSIGQVLKIPTSSSNNTPTTNNTYIVKSGESLWSIAKKFNTTVDSIKKKNNLSSNKLSILEFFDNLSSSLKRLNVTNFL